MPPTAGVRSMTISSAIAAPYRTSGLSRSSLIPVYFVP